MTETKDQTKHPLWSVKGVPQPTDADLNWWEKQKKTKGALFKAYWSSCKSNHIWRVATIIDYRASQDTAEQFDLNQRKLASSYDTLALYSGAEIACRKNNYVIMEVISHVSNIELKKFYDNDKFSFYDRRQLMESKQWKLITSLIETNQLGRDLIEMSFEKVFKEKDCDGLRKLLSKKHGIRPEKLLSLLLDQGFEKEQYKILSDAFPQIEQLNQSGTPKQSNDPASDIENQPCDEWQKYTDTSIWHNMPYDEHGTRLRQLFDFASRRVKEYQQMPNGRQHLESDRDFGDFSATHGISRAQAELEKRGGETFSPTKTADTAKKIPA